MAALFDAYLAVDWSARSRPSPARPSADSIWIGERVRDPAAATERNPRTRRAARDLLGERIEALATAGRRVLVGFDFALGYPAGFARSLGLGPSWLAVWRELERLVVDGADNANNRFEVASALNARCGGPDPGPLWGCPVPRRTGSLASTSPVFPYRGLPRLRWTDRGAVQPVWKLYGNGSVGSQTLLGIPVAAHLRWTAAGSSGRVWPFETGFTADLPAIVYAEIWPPLAKSAYEPGAAVKDQGQVRALARWLSEKDEDGTLAELFGPHRGLPPEGVAAAVEEEGWILGV